MSKSKKNKSFEEADFIDILDSSKIGLWIIEIDNNTGINRMYCNDTMLELLGRTERLSPEKCFEFWYSRIHKGYYSYIEKAIEKICVTGNGVEVQYPWKHPILGDIKARCFGRFISLNNGVIKIKGFHQNINDFYKMEVILSKSDNEIFEWYQDNNIAYVHTHYNQIYKDDELTIENFPQSWIDNGIVQDFFKDVYLEAFNRINNGSKKSVCDIKMKNKNGKYVWFRMTLLSKKSQSDISSTVIGTLENINNLKEMEMAYTTDSKFYKSLLEELCAYGKVNVSKNKFLYVSGLWNIYSGIIGDLGMSEILQKNILKTIHPDDREKYFKLLHHKNLLEEYNKGNNLLKYKFRRVIDKENIRWIDFTVTLFRDTYENDILGFLYFKDIDNKSNDSNKYIEKLTLEEPVKSLDITVDKVNYDIKDYKSINEVLSAESDNIAYIIDPVSYKLIDANDTFFNFFKMDKEECIDKECYKIIYNKEKPCSFCKNIFWSYSDFFIWNQYNKHLKKDLLLKNKLISLNNKKCMFTLGTSIPLEENIEKYNINQDISKVILSSITHLCKEYNYEDNINYILELICKFYNSELGFVFTINKKDEISSSYYSYLENNLENKIKLDLENIILNEFINSPIKGIKYLSGEQEAIPISHSLYNFMIQYKLCNMLIIPIVSKNNYIGYIICIDSNKIENNHYYENMEEYCNSISYFIGEQIIKSNLEKELQLEKNYDTLTGVLNRNAYRIYEKHYDSDNIENIGVICLALNELNNINHTAGILAGDQIILNLSNILKSQFNKNIIFRLNGNEFLILIENIEYEIFLEEIENLSKSLEKIGLSMTYGKAWSSNEKELNHLVNSAIHFRKAQSNKNRELVNDTTCKRNTLLREVMLSIETKEYEIFLQPKVQLKDNNLCGAEALIRKRNLEGGYVSPDKFIPILEHHYLIHYIDLFVFEEVLKLLESWKKKNKPLIPISLNFSRRTLLEDDIVKMVSDIKNRYDVDPKYIEIEVTESIGDLEKQAICTVLKKIENMGISILLDDFGVKYSNLTILSEIDFDGLKLDKIMVKNLGENAINEVIMKNIICMCKELNIKTIAEGVETKEQEEVLRNMNCDMVQGYLYSKPVSVSEFLKNNDGYFNCI